MTRFLDRGGTRIAYRSHPGRVPGVFFLPGFLSDMTGTKAAALHAFAAARGHAFAALDYFGHGESGGDAAEGTISRWRDDVLAVLDAACPTRVVLVGSSMGGWLALLAAIVRPERMAGLVGIAAAPDFTERLVWLTMSDEERAVLARDGVLRLPSAYGGEQVFSRALIEDGRRNLLLERPIPFGGPVRLLQGQRDPDVPWETALAIAARIESKDVRVTLVKDGDHRLSRPPDLALLERTVGELLGGEGRA